MCCWIWFILRIFTSVFNRDILAYSFLLESLSGFGCQGNVYLVKWVWKYSLLFWGGIWEGLALILWMFGRVHQWSHLVLGFSFLITSSISLDSGLFKILPSSWFSLGSWCFQEFILGYPVSLCTIKRNLLHFHGFSCNVPSHFWFWVFFFFLSLVKDLPILFIFFRKSCS